MKRLSRQALCLMLCLAVLLTPALAVVARPANGYVADNANVLSPELEQDIIGRNQTLSQSTGAEIAVVSVEFLDGLDIESYAYACFEEWGIGDGSRNNGLLLLFATDEYNDQGLKLCLAVKGVGLERALSDATLNGWMEDYFYDDFDNDNYDGAVQGFFDAAYNWLLNYYAGTGIGTTVTPVEQVVPDSGLDAGFILGDLIVFTIFLFITVVFLIAIFAAFRGVRRGYGYYTPYRSWRPIFFWRRRRYGPPPPPRPPRPPSYHAHTGGGFFSTGGASRGGGVGRRGGGSSSFRSSGHSSFRGGGSFRSGGHTRGGGVGRR